MPQAGAVKFKKAVSGKANDASPGLLAQGGTLPRVVGRIGAALLFIFVLPGQQNNSFQGSVPSGSASATTLALKLDDAIQRGLKFNLGLLESQTASDTARAERIQALSALLPQVTGTVSETAEQLNLKTLGFSLAPNPFITIPANCGSVLLHLRSGRTSLPRSSIGARLGI